MTRPIEWAKASFAEAIAQGPAPVVFEKWKDENDEPFRCFVFPMSVEDLDAIYKARAQGGLQGLIAVILRRARNEDRTRIFKDPERIVFMKECLGDDICDLADLINNAVPEVDSKLGGGPKKA